MYWLHVSFQEEGVDFIAGPDAYRELPALLASATTDQKAANIQLRFSLSVYV